MPSMNRLHDMFSVFEAGFVASPVGMSEAANQIPHFHRSLILKVLPLTVRMGQVIVSTQLQPGSQPVRAPPNWAFAAEKLGRLGGIWSPDS